MAFATRLLAIGLLLSVVGCGTDGDEAGMASAVGDRPQSSLDPSDFAVAWTGADGEELPDGVGEPNPELVINTVRGPEHCGWQSAVLMHLAWPLGSVTRTTPPARQYARDPSGVLPGGGASAQFDLSATLPPDAEATGMRNGDIELWVAPSTADQEVYVGVDGVFEAWPRLNEPVACA